MGFGLRLAEVGCEVVVVLRPRSFSDRAISSLSSKTGGVVRPERLDPADAGCHNHKTNVAANVSSLNSDIEDV